MNPLVTTVVSDFTKYFITDNRIGNNAVMAATVVGAPDIIQFVDRLTAGVDPQVALSVGGSSMYLALGIYVLKFALYLISKKTQTQVA